MGTADIVFYVLADIAPMGVVVALLTLSIALSNGAGVPGTYAVAGLAHLPARPGSLPTHRQAWHPAGPLPKVRSRRVPAAPTVAR